ncbi:MAG: hypothetical protein AAFR87_20680 [Bacteroidota bacterium]
MRYLLFFVSLSFYLQIHAQNGKANSFAAAYYSAYGYQPGFIIKAERTYFRSAGANYGKKSKKIHPFLSLEFGTYAHFQNNLYLNGSFSGGLRRSGKKGRSISIFASMGVMRTQHLISTYQLDESGNLNTVRGAGNWSALPGFGMGIGGPSPINRGKKLIPYANFRTQVQLPYNDSFLLHPMLELGFYFNK